MVLSVLRARDIWGEKRKSNCQWIKSLDSHWGHNTQIDLGKAYSSSWHRRLDHLQASFNYIVLFRFPPSHPFMLLYLTCGVLVLMTSFLPAMRIHVGSLRLWFWLSGNVRAGVATILGMRSDVSSSISSILSQIYLALVLEFLRLHSKWISSCRQLECISG